MDFSQTLSIIHTVAQKEEATAQLQLFLESLYKKKGYMLSQKHKMLLDTLLSANSIKETDMRAVESCVKAYIEYARNLPAITLTIAFDPKTDEVAQIYAWFTTNVKKQLLLDLKIDPSLLGGATILCEGIYKDYSLDRFLQSLNLNINERS